MNENCRHSKETHSFSPEQLAAAARLLVWSLTLCHTHSSTTAGIIACLSLQNNSRAWAPSVSAQGYWPISVELQLWVGGFWVQPLGGRVLWLGDLALFGNLSSSLLPLFALSMLQYRSRSLSHKHTNSPSLPPPLLLLLPSLPPFLQVTDLRMEITRGFASTLQAHKLTCFLFTYNLIFVHWCFLQSVDTMLTVCVTLVYMLVVKP